jgi:hypothetical protein
VRWLTPLPNDCNVRSTDRLTLLTILVGSVGDVPPNMRLKLAGAHK